MKDTSTSAILSIKPIYAHAIMSGEKKVEFRKKVFKKKIERVYVYSSSPDQKIIGYFTIKEIIEDTPNQLWNTFNKVGGINRDAFFDYYKGVEKGYSIVIKEFKKYREAVDPYKMIKNFNAPQSYLYIDTYVPFLNKEYNEIFPTRCELVS